MPLFVDGGVDPELDSGVCIECVEAGPPVVPVGVPAIESGSSLKDGGTWECGGDGVAAADVDSIDGGVPTEFVGLDGFGRRLRSCVVFGGVALLLLLLLL